MPSQAGATPDTAPAGTIASRGTLTVRRARRRSAAVHAENGPGDHFGDMALTGHSHRPGKITATTHLPCPQGLPARVVLTPPSWPAAVAAGPAPARHRIDHYAPSSKARVWQSYRAYSAIRPGL
jgi:hypothetical protein